MEYVTWPLREPPTYNTDRVRPQNEVELEARCRVVAHQTPGEPQLVLGRDKQFTYDYLYDMASRQADIFDGCVRDLVDGYVTCSFVISAHIGCL